jgi:N-acetylmuramoyl-L-alanine amidase
MTSFHRIGTIPAAMSAGLALIATVMLAWLLVSRQQAPPYVQRIALTDPAVQALPLVRGCVPGSSPLVVIDPGHGGFDPGAVAADGMQEKGVVLALSRALRDRLLAQGGVRVALTREDDRFLSLEERSGLARRLGADLFISVHADSGGEEMNAAGASLYTLSTQASGREAARFAARENSADVVNGTPLRTGTGNAAVDTILFELSQRKAQEDAAEFARLVVREGTGRLVFREPPRRSAALVVLTAPDVPSVLFEAGFVTNPDEARRLSSAEGREQFAEVTAAAVRSYFANRNRTRPE